MYQGEILHDNFLLTKRVGKGSFCELFVAFDISKKDIITTKSFAVKLQKAGVDPSNLRWEADVLRSLASTPHAPKFHHFDTHKGKEYIIMEYLSGEDMSRLRDVTRSTTGGAIPLQVTLHISIQMLDCIAALHNKGFVHRDIKPANFVRRNVSSTDFCVVDFGLAKSYRGRSGNIRPQRESAEFRGTTVYASLHAHNREDLCPRDDLFSFFFVCLDFMCGKLPWSEAARMKDKSQVAVIKEEYLVTNRDKLLVWIQEHALKNQASLIEKYGKSNLYQFVGKLADDFGRKCLEILICISSLGYEDVPDYEHIKDSIKGLIDVSEELERVKKVSYASQGFSWINNGPSSEAGMSSSSDINSVKVTAVRQSSVLPSDEAKIMLCLMLRDPTTLVKVIAARAKCLGKEIMKLNQEIDSATIVSSARIGVTLGDVTSYSSGGEVGESYVDSLSKKLSGPCLSSTTTVASTIVSDRRLSLALKWKELFDDLVAIDESLITRETVDLFESLIRDQCRFFHSIFSEDPALLNEQKFETFRLLQQAAYEISERIRYRVYKRPRELVSFSSTPLSSIPHTASAGGLAGSSLPLLSAPLPPVDSKMKEVNETQS